MGIEHAKFETEPISMVLVCHNEGENLRGTVDNLLDTMPAGSEIVVVDDNSDDGSSHFLDGYANVRVLRTLTRLGVANARNHGAAAATARIIAFTDAHVRLNSTCVRDLCSVLTDSHIGLAAPVVSDMEDTSRKGYGRTTSEALTSSWLTRRSNEPYPVPALCGMFLVLRRELFQELGGFDSGMKEWGYEDLEISMRLWMMGYQCVVVPSAEVAHLFRDRPPYALKETEVLQNRLRVGFVHLSGPRLARFVDSLRSEVGFASELARAVGGDLCARREQVRARRRFDDEWYLNQVCAPFERG